MVFRVLDKTSGAVLAERAQRATGFGARLKGLLGKGKLEAGEALHLAPCRSIHTFLMRFPIDVLFLSHEDVVLKALHDLPPWRATSIHWRALSVLELPAGTLARCNTGPGHRICFQKVEKPNLVGPQRPLC